jgi:hypothetical protein
MATLRGMENGQAIVDPILITMGECRLIDEMQASFREGGAIESGGFLTLNLAQG